MKNHSRDIELEKQIDAYVKGRLTDDQEHKLWVRLLQKPGYMDLLETELYIKSIIEEDSSQSKSAAPIHITFFNHPRRWAAAAASIGILVIALNLLIDSQRNTIQPLALDSINIVEHMASPEIVRADVSNLSEADSILSNGFKAAIAGQFNESMLLYKEVISDFPANTSALAQAHYNIGVIHYNDKNFTNAASAFRQALEITEQNPVLAEKNLWFLSNAYIHLGEYDKAQASIRQVYNFDGIYREAAARLTNRLKELPDHTTSSVTE